MASVLILTGSPSSRSRTAALALHVGDELALEGHAVDVIHLRGLPTVPLLSADTADPAIAAAVRAVIAADAVVVATPIDRTSRSGLLRSFLDLLPQSALAGTVVLPLATGRTAPQPPALLDGLQPVLRSLGARQVVAGRFVPDGRIDHLTGGPVLLDEATREDVRRAVEDLRTALGEARTEAVAAWA